MTETRFTDLSLSDPLLASLAEMGYVHPTPVQESGIPLVATGRDLMVQSQTGTGKTAAFGIPILERLDPKDRGIKALILAPTRELAKQVAEEINRLGTHRQVRAVAIYGGASYEKQVAEARFAQIVAGTPGRVLDHLRRQTLRLDGLSTLVLDEADEMLSMGFARELDLIMGFVPERRQTLLFSATIPEDIKRYARRYMREPEFLSLVEENVAADDVEHIYFMVSGVGRTRDLIRVLESEAPDSAIIFTNTRKDSEQVARALKKHGMDAEYLNGDMTQRDRERVMTRAKEKTLRFLVATDVAARGIDISDLSHVINYKLPESPEVYIHRTGRTGRAGASGTALSLIGPREIGVYYYLKRLYNVALVERTVPTQAEIELRQEEKRTEKLVSEIIEGVGPVDEGLRPQVMRLLEREDAPEVVQALLHAFRVGGRRAGPRVGGILADAPKPKKLEPGSRAQTLQGLADRVAIVQSEFRGLPADHRRASAPAAAQAAVEAPVVEAPAKAALVAPPVEEAPAGALAAEPDDLPSADDSMDASVDASVDDSLDSLDSLDDSLDDGALDDDALDDDSLDDDSSVDDSSVDDSGDDWADDSAEETADEEPAELQEPQAPATVRLFINLGRRDFDDDAAFAESLSDLAGLWPEDIVSLDVRARHSYVEVAPEFAEDLVEAVTGERYGRKTMRVELARD